MLTKDLIRCRVDHGFVRPRFVRTDDSDLLQLAERLLRVYQAEPPPTRGDVSEVTQAVTAAESDPVLARGLNKIILDRCEFAHPGTCDFPGGRERLFVVAGRLLANQPDDDPDTFRQRVIDSAELPPALTEQGIYADLPENERLQRFKDMSARQVLERYNVGLVQALLLRAQSLELTVGSVQSAGMRRLLKYLRFFRLLARLYNADPDGDRASDGGRTIRMTIDGPASILSKPKRYGLQLASFFPAVCALDDWLLDTPVEWKGATRRLRLTQKTGLVSHYRNFSAYVPEEIKLFHRHFRKTVSHWNIVGETPFLSVGGQEIVFPDLSFEHENGTVLHLELFHRWHAGQLLERLRRLSVQADLPLVVGVDRALLKDGAAAAACENSQWFQERGFLFKDYPSVDRAVACLDRAALQITTGPERDA